MKPFSRGVLLATLPFLLTGLNGYAQAPQPPTPAEAQAALAAAPAPAAFTNAQLDQLLAPIALYPDQLLTQVLMAATFTEQLIDAQKWLQDPANAALKGDDLANALQPLPWDPSVKSLVPVPGVIAMMVSHLDWTEALGVAFATQEVQTFARVQYLRERAVKAGKLRSNAQIAVAGGGEDITIEPADPNMLYVPVYDPAEVYGAWPDNDYPPVYLPPPPGFYNGPPAAGIGFSVGIGIVAPLWGWGHPDWRHHSVAVDPHRFQTITRETVETRNHVTVEGGTWHRSGPVAFVPQAQRPHPLYQGGEPPKGTVRPSAVVRPGFAPGPQHAAPNAGQRPAGEPSHAGPQPAGQAQPGPQPEEQRRREEHAAPPSGPNPAAEPPRHEEHAAPPPGTNPAGEAPRHEEHPAPQPGTNPAGEAPRHEEHAAPQPGPNPAGEPSHHEEHAAPQPGPNPAGEPSHHEEHAAPQPGPHPAAEPPRHEEHAAPPQTHAPETPRPPETVRGGPGETPHPAPPASGSPPHAAGPPAQPHGGPPQGPPPGGHPAPPQQHQGGPPQHQGGPPHEGGPPGDEDKR